MCDLIARWVELDHESARASRAAFTRTSCIHRSPSGGAGEVYGHRHVAPARGDHARSVLTVKPPGAGRIRGPGRIVGHPEVGHRERDQR